MADKIPSIHPAGNSDSDADAGRGKSGIFISGTSVWNAAKWLAKKAPSFLAGTLVCGLGVFAVSHHPGSDRHPTAHPSPTSVTSDLEVTNVQGGPGPVPCKPTVQGRGHVPQGMTAAVYAEDMSDHQHTNWFEPVPNISGTHWWVNISLKTANDQYVIGTILIPRQLATYLSSTEKWKDFTYTYWSSPEFPPGALPGQNTVPVTRTGQSC